jgi:membrane-bound metal-dependent hydrolase YbcI (DUF457 family)
MDWKSHITIAGTIALLALLYFFPSVPPARAIALLFAACASSLLPDFDHPKSKSKKSADIFAFIAASAISFAIYVQSGSASLSIIAAIAILSLWLFFSKFFIPRHRGLLHSAAFSIFFGLAILLISQDAPLALFALLGYLSHLASDFTFKLL